jgi:hypothetical protein
MEMSYLDLYMFPVKRDLDSSITRKPEQWMHWFVILISCRISPFVSISQIHCHSSQIMVLYGCCFSCILKDSCLFIFP